MWIHTNHEYGNFTIGLITPSSDPSYVICLKADLDGGVFIYINGTKCTTNFIGGMHTNAWSHVAIIFKTNETTVLPTVYVYINGFRYTYSGNSIIQNLNNCKLGWYAETYPVQFTNLRVCNFRAYDTTLSQMLILNFPNILPIMSRSIYHINSVIIYDINNPNIPVQDSNYSTVSVYANYTGTGSVDITTQIRNYVILPSTSTLTTNSIPFEIRVFY